MKSRPLIFFIFINILKSFSSEFLGDFVPYTYSEISESMESDLAKCTCNLSPFCDYNCWCDDDCSEEEKRSQFNLKEKDFVYNNNRMKQFMCSDSKQDNFDYNKNKAGINLKDHIFNLMCIQIDRSGDMGEFYLDKYEDQSDWVDTFFYNKENTIPENALNFSYKPDSNGYCIPSVITPYNNLEYSCIYTSSQINNNQEVDQVNNNGRIERISNMKYIKESQQIRNEYFRKSTSSHLIDFTIRWNGNTNNNRPSSYIQGSPIVIRIPNDNNNDHLYDQYFIPIINNDGTCIYNQDFENVVNIKPILFKNKAIYSCIMNGPQDPNSLYIFDFLQKIRICSSPKADNCQNILINNLPNEFNIIELYIFIRKEGDENSKNEIISFSGLNVKNENRNDGLLIFRVIFIDISDSSINNAKEGKITSLKDLPTDIIKYFSNLM